MDSQTPLRQNLNEQTADKFFYFLCQSGFEAILKAEVLKQFPGSKFSFSKKGLLTFKGIPEKLERQGPKRKLVNGPGGAPSEQRFLLPLHLNRLVFAQDGGTALSKPTTSQISALIESLAKLLQSRPDVSHLYLLSTKENSEDPDDQRMSFLKHFQKTLQREFKAIQIQCQGEKTEPNAKAISVLFFGHKLNAAVPEKLNWLLGEPFPSSFPTIYPRVGSYLLDLQANRSQFPSRAYLKTQECFERYAIPFKKNEIALEIGSAPGGSVQFLLEKGLKVVGVDPAKMELDGLSAGLLKNYQHVAHSVFDCVPKDFPEKVEWLLIDIHAQPLITIKALEKLVTFPFAMSLKGALITLKLSRRHFSHEVRLYQRRLELLFIKKTGLKKSFLKQLSSNRQEVCLFITGNLES